jgi:hypothetical protein
MALHPFRHLGRSKIHRYLPLFGAIYRYPSDSRLTSPDSARLSRTHLVRPPWSSAFPRYVKDHPGRPQSIRRPIFRLALKTVAIIHQMSGLSTPRPDSRRWAVHPEVVGGFFVPPTSQSAVSRVSQPAGRPPNCPPPNLANNIAMHGALDRPSPGRRVWNVE